MLLEKSIQLQTHNIRAEELEKVKERLYEDIKNNLKWISTFTWGVFFLLYTVKLY